MVKLENENLEDFWKKILPYMISVSRKVSIIEIDESLITLVNIAL